MVCCVLCVSQLNGFETNRSTSTTIQTISVWMRWFLLSRPSPLLLQPHSFGLNFLSTLRLSFTLVLVVFHSDSNVPVAAVAVDTGNGGDECRQPEPKIRKHKKWHF